MTWEQRSKYLARNNRLKAGLLFSLSIFMALSLFGYHPADPSLNSFGLSLKVMNYCGLVGAILADLFYQFFGLSSWLFILGGLLFSYKLFVSRFRESVFRPILFFSLFLLSFASLGELHFPKFNFYQPPIHMGGAFGAGMISILKPLFHWTGTAVILWSVFLLLLLSYGPRFSLSLSFKQFFISFVCFFKKIPVFVSSLFIKIKEIGVWQFIFLKKLISKIKGFIFRKKDLPPLDKFSKEKFEDKTPEEPLKNPPEPHFVFREKDFLSESKTPLRENPIADKPENSPLDSPASKQMAAPQNYTPAPLPSIDILSESQSSSEKLSRQDVEDLSKKLLDKLSQFFIKGEITAVKTGPAVALFEFRPENHIKVSRIREMESDLSLALSSESVRIIAPIPGRDVVGIEASRPFREMVYLKNLLKQEDFFKAELPLVLGRRADNAIGIRDLSRIPHLLVAGTTGSGKSMFIISFISSLLFRHSPETLRILLIDPKQVDLSGFKDIPHLLSPIITSSNETVRALSWAEREMEKRYRSLALFATRDHKSFNEKISCLKQKEKKLHMEKNQELPDSQSYYFEPLPLICIVIEEFGDLMADRSIRRSVENSVVRLAQKARASGIHLVLAMQSPRKDVVTGLIKTNIPGRISFKVASGTDSRVILDEGGAEKLLSHGDMLFLEPGTPKPTRYHGPFIREKDVWEIGNYWRSQSSVLYEESLLQGNSADFLDKGSSNEMDIKRDPMYGEIMNFVKTCDVVSASFLQRKFRIGYPRAARMIEVLFEEGKIGPPQGSKPREVLIHK